MEPVRPDLVPRADQSREEMRSLQEAVAASAVFRDDPPLDPSAIDQLLVAGVDQAFLDDRAVSAVVVRRDGRTVERAEAVVPIEIPYIPGYLSFREGNPILQALGMLSVVPDLLLFDGSGRIHYRQAGLATHIGVVLDLPAVGIAKGLLCGTPRRPTTGLAAGELVPIEANADVDAPDGTLIGYAVQTRQFTGSDRHVNPVFVSPGHRTSADTAAALALAFRAGYKLPEPVRLADQHAAAVKRTLR